MFILGSKSFVSSCLTDVFCLCTETAENIGYSCNLLREEMNEIFIVSGNSPEDVRQELRSEEAFRKKPSADYEKHLCASVHYLSSCPSRDARTSMKPDADEESVFLPERSLGKGVKVVRDEVANGEYGLVINGHSLVPHYAF